MFYQPEENPTLDRIFEKYVQHFLCLDATILNSERELSWVSFLRKYKQHTTNLGDKLF